jgi:hypothetical protein
MVPKNKLAHSVPYIYLFKHNTCYQKNSNHVTTEKHY